MSEPLTAEDLTALRTILLPKLLATAEEAQRLRAMTAGVGWQDNVKLRAEVQRLRAAIERHRDGWKSRKSDSTANEKLWEALK